VSFAGLYDGRVVQWGSNNIGWQQQLLSALGAEALGSVDGLQSYFAVQHRHPDGLHWLDVAHFASRHEAKAAMRSAIGAGHAQPGELRARKVTRPAT
jgi:hypothetical protein